MTTLLRAGEAASEAATVTKALLRAGAELGLTRRELAKIVDVSEPQISRMGDGSKFLQAHRSHQWGSSLLVIRIYRGLIATFGSKASATQWIHGYNTALNAIPADLMQNYEGLVDVARYVDYQRGQI